MAEYIVEYPSWVEEFIDVRDRANLHERIVRCRDCKFGIKDEYGDIECHSDQWQGYAGLCNEVNPDGFCAWGERRGDA